MSDRPQRPPPREGVLSAHMAGVSISTEIGRPASEVFDYVADMSNNPEWQRGQVSCTWTSPPPIDVGATYDQKARFLGMRINSSFEVTEFEPGRRIRIVSTSGPMSIDVTREVASRDERTSMITATVAGEVPRPLRRFSGLIDWLVKRRVRSDYDRLKRSLEADPLLPPNHHGDHRPARALVGYIAALTLILGRQRDTDVVVRRTGGVGSETRLLDVGCGPGNAVRTAARAGAQATGLDPSGPMLRVARVLTRLRRIKGSVKWAEAGAESIPLPDASVNLVWSIKAVHHWPHLADGLSEVRRVLQPGGRFIALEKKSAPGATGSASHGWTHEQAKLLADMLCDDHGFLDVEVREHAASRSTSVLTVEGRVPDALHVV